MGGNILSKLTSKPLEFNEKPADETVTDMKTATDPASDKRPEIETVLKENTAEKTVPNENKPVETVPKENQAVETGPKENPADETGPKENKAVETVLKENTSDETVLREKQNDEKISNEKHSDKTTSNDKPAEERFVFKKWNAVVSWSYEVENCEFCKQGIQDLCNECKADAIEKDKYEACPVVWGFCDHCFHFHCTKKFPKNIYLDTICPLCHEMWAYTDME